MPDNSPILALPFIQPSQAQKHVTHNEALVRLDAIVQLVIEALDQTTPPVSPTEDKVYHIGAAPSGAWVGQAGKLAFFSGGAWEFVSPRAGWRAWVVATSDLQVFSGTAWLSTGVAQNNLPGVGIGTSFDATNKLAVSAAGSLFTHAGSDHRMVLNKAGVADTGSLIFQNNFSGRAELGLTGDDNLHLRVSPTGSGYQDALTINSDTRTTNVSNIRSGIISIPSDGVGLVETPGAGGFVLIAAIDPLYPRVNHGGLFFYDTGPSISISGMAMGNRTADLGTTVLTGTTGTSTWTSVAVSSGHVQIENRQTTTYDYSYTFLGGY